jgi:uncharacterized protein (TIGR00369 family)
MDLISLEFSRLIGLQALYQNGQTIVVLDPDHRHWNHLQIVHGSVIFAMAETAGGLGLAEQLAEFKGTATGVLRKANVEFLKPATGRLIAKYCLDDDTRSIIAERALQKRFTPARILVEVLSNEIMVAKGFFDFVIVRKKEAENS